MIVAGIDPGMSGALAIWDGKSLSVYDMPIYQRQVGGKTRAAIDARGLYEMIGGFVAIGVECVWVEDVVGHGMQMGASTMGYGVGLIHMACIANDLRYEKIAAGAWKAKMRAPKDKKQSVIRAGQLFPAFAGLFRGPKGGALDGRAEAAMMAMFGRDRLCLR